MSIRQGNKIISGVIQGGGFEVGDIGIAPLGIDESQGTRKYLNGQTISQELYLEFTQKVKKMAEMCPSISCSNDEFNQEVQLSALGQCGKFVIDNVNKKIRLPLIVNIQGLTDLSKAGVRVEAGLPNIEGTFTATGLMRDVANPKTTGSLYTASNLPNVGGYGETSYGLTNGIGIDASKSNPIYGKSDTVQEEAVQYPFFIQVAVSVKNNVDITNEYQLNNPYSLLDCKWSDHKLNNISWLLSAGQYNSGTVYKPVYDLLLKDRCDGMTDFYCYVGENPYYVKSLPAKVGDKVYNKSFVDIGTIQELGMLDDSIIVSAYVSHEGVTDLAGELTRNASKDTKGYSKNIFSVKLITESYTDYDFVLDTANTTFRLPIKTKLASGRGVAGNGTTLGLTNGTTEFGLSVTGGNRLYDSSNVDKPLGYYNRGASSVAIDTGVGITTDPTKSGIETSNDGLYLYFYVGETVQNINLIDIGGITELLVDLSNELDKKLNDSPSLDLVIDYKINSDGSWYRKYKSGWIEQGGKYTAGANTFVNVTLLKPMANDLYYANARQYSWWNKDKYAVIQTIRTTTTTVSIGNVWDGGVDGTWYVCGQGA